MLLDDGGTGSAASETVAKSADGEKVGRILTGARRRRLSAASAGLCAYGGPADSTHRARLTGLVRSDVLQFVAQHLSREAGEAEVKTRQVACGSGCAGAATCVLARVLD